MALSFEWDPRKDRSNKRKHGISFKEAQTVFFDENARFMGDPDHSEAENRFLILGLSSKLRTLIVCHCYRAADTVIRVISARRAIKNERALYEERIK